MRISALKQSGKHFGNLHKIYGQYSFALAPSEQDPLKGYTKSVFINVFKEYVGKLWWMYTPPAVGLYLLYDWAKRTNYQANRKDPKEYENDV